jgi:hypothetical protein
VGGGLNGASGPFSYKRPGQGDLPPGFAAQKNGAGANIQDSLMKQYAGDRSKWNGAMLNREKENQAYDASLKKYKELMGLSAPSGSSSGNTSPALGILTPGYQRYYEQAYGQSSGSTLG